MSLFKDKPLKKCHTDKRKMLDEYHQIIVNNADCALKFFLFSFGQFCSILIFLKRRKKENEQKRMQKRKKIAQYFKERYYHYYHCFPRTFFCSEKYSNFSCKGQKTNFLYCF